MQRSRRQFIFGSSAGLGSIALTALLQQDRLRAGTHHPAKAKACIFLTMEGGPSHIDTFDPKPKLSQLHMTEFVRRDKFASAMESGTRYFVQSPFQFRKVGQAGIEMCEDFSELAGGADESCFFRGGVAGSSHHRT